MLLIPLLTIAAVVALAFANGANDVSKGIATLAGSRRTSYRAALMWGTAWTAAGAFAAVVISIGLVQVFTTSLVAADVLALEAFPLAVAAGASLWVLVASLTGLPVSTTHAITGAIVGVAFTVGGIGAIHWGVMLTAVAAPLALSPLVSGVLGWGVHAPASRLADACVCADEGELIAAADGTLVGRFAPAVVSSVAGCAPTAGRARLLTGGAVHWGAAAAISFARGVNDNPKIAALGTLAFASMGAGVGPAFALTALAMTVGAGGAGLRVSRTLGERVVDMQADTGLASALVAAVLVLAASFFTLPVSTTHVATGAIVGAGVRQGNGSVHWTTVGGLCSAWLITLPACALFGAAAVWLLA